MQGGLDPKANQMAPATESEWREYIERRFAHGDARMTSIEDSIAANTKLTKESIDIVSDVRDIVLLGRSVFSALGKIGAAGAWCWKWISKLIRASAAIALAYTAVRAAIWAWKTGGPPPPR